MANITGDCTVGETIELIPDDVNNIIPPGYLDNGSLPLETVDADLGVVAGSGTAITGDCAYSTIECPEGQILGCHTPVVDDAGYPLGPPRITECIDISYDVPKKLIHVDNKIFSMYETNVTLRSVDLVTTIWSATTTLSSPKFRAITYSPELNEYFASGYHLPNNSYIQQNHFVIRISSTGVVLQEYTTETTDTWAGCGNDSSLDLIYKDGGIYLAGYWQYLDSFWSGVKQGYLVFDLLTGEISQVVGFSSTQSSNSRTSIAISETTDTVYIGRGAWTGPSGTVNHLTGELWKGTLNAGIESFSLVKTGSRDSTGYIDDNFAYASHIEKIGDYLCVSYGFNFNDSHWINPRSTGGAYSSEIDIFDFESGAFVKTLKVDSINNITINDGNSFGFKISTYGNFILVSADTQRIDPDNANSASGAVYLYDKDFNFLQKLILSPVLLSNESWGYHTWMTSDTIFIGGTQARNYSGQNLLKKCSYINFGV